MNLYADWTCVLRDEVALGDSELLSGKDAVKRYYKLLVDQISSDVSKDVSLHQMGCKSQVVEVSKKCYKRDPDVEEESCGRESSCAFSTRSDHKQETHRREDTGLSLVIGDCL